MDQESLVAKIVIEYVQPTKAYALYGYGQANLCFGSFDKIFHVMSDYIRQSFEANQMDILKCEKRELYKLRAKCADGEYDTDEWRQFFLRFAEVNMLPPRLFEITLANEDARAISNDEFVGLVRNM